MRYHQFGNTGLRVSELGIGTARLGGLFEGKGATELVHLLQSASDQGINFFDTSDMYTQGESEKLLGKAFRARRSTVVLATKGGYVLPARRKVISRVKPLLRPAIQMLGLKRAHLPVGASGALTQDFSPAYLTTAVENSLRRLRTDYIDIYQLHSPPVEVLASGEFLEPLERMRRDGKIRHIGVSCERPEDALLCLRYPLIESIQLPLNLLHPQATKHILPQLSQRSLGVIARECYAGGALAKAVAGTSTYEMLSDVVERKRVQQYAQIARAMGYPLRDIALQYVMRSEGVSVTLVGIRTNEHLVDAISIANGSVLSDIQYQEIRSVGLAIGQS